MNDKPDRIAFGVYKKALHHHETIATLLKNLLAHADYRRINELGELIAHLTKMTDEGQRVARALIEAWHRDVAAAAEWHNEVEAMIKSGYKRNVLHEVRFGDVMDLR